MSRQVLRSLPRRSRLRERTATAAAVAAVGAGMPAASPGAVARCLLAWLVAFTRIAGGDRWDILWGRDTPARRFARMRAVLERMGPAAVKVSEQLAHRIDLLPHHASGLARMDDEAPPFPIEQALERIEADLGRPLEEVFEALDPEPIASSSVDCKYQAVLRPVEGDAPTAATADGAPPPAGPPGANVVVRVRRPEARADFAVQLAALHWLTRGLEGMAVLRPGFLEHVSTELSAIVTEELDFRVQARYQSLLTRRLRKDRMRQVRVAPLHTTLLTHRVMVSGFVSGVRLSEILVAVADPAPENRRWLQAMEVDPRRVAHDLLEYAWWCLFENDFFDAGIEADHIVVTRGGHIGLIAFGHFTTAQGKTRRMMRELFRRMSLGEVTGATEVVLQALSPLPFIDAHSFGKRLEARLWQQYFAMKDRGSSPSERSSAGLWRAIMEAAAEDGVPVHQDLVAMLRAAVATEELALRLDPRRSVLRSFRRYMRRAERRRALRFARRLDRQSQRRPAVTLYATADRALRLVDRMTFLTETVAENLPIANLTLPSKASTVISELLAYAVNTASLFVGVAVALAAWRGVTTGVIPPPMRLLIEVLGLPPLWMAAALLLLLTLRRSQFRLQDKDPDS